MHLPPAATNPFVRHGVGLLLWLLRHVIGLGGVHHLLRLHDEPTAVRAATSGRRRRHRLYVVLHNLVVMLMVLVRLLLLLVMMLGSMTVTDRTTAATVGQRLVQMRYGADAFLGDVAVRVVGADVNLSLQTINRHVKRLGSSSGTRRQCRRL